MSYLGDLLAGTTLYTKFSTAAGAPTTLSGSPVVSIYKDNSTTESTTGVTLTVDFDSRTGLNHVTVDMSQDATFYAAGHNYQAVITTGTVGGVSVVGMVVAEWSVINRSVALSSAGAVTVGTNSDKTGYSLTQTFPSNFSALGITAGGKISGVVLSDTITTYTGDTPQTGDSFARIGALGAGLTAVQAFGDFTSTQKTSLNAATPASVTGAVGSVTGNVGGNVVGSVGSISGVSFPTNFGTLAITAAGKISEVVLTDTITTYTGNTPQTGDAFGRIGVAGVGLTNLGDTRIAHLDADVSSRLAPGGTLATVTNLTNAPTVGDFTATMKASITAATISQAGVRSAVGMASANLDTQLSTIDADVLTRLAASAYTAPDNTDIATILSRTDVATSTRLATSGYTAPDNADIATILTRVDVATSTRLAPGGTLATVTNLTNAPTSGDFTAVMKTSLNAATPTVDLSGVPAAVWANGTRTLTAFSFLVGLTSAYDAAKTASQPGDSMALTTPAQDAAADTLLGRNLAGGSDGGRTVQDALRPLRNKVDTQSVPGFVLIFEEDDTTEAWRGALTTDASADPVVTVEPT